MQNDKTFKPVASVLRRGATRRPDDQSSSFANGDRFGLESKTERGDDRGLTFGQFDGWLRVRSGIRAGASGGSY